MRMGWRLDTHAHNRWMFSTFSIQHFQELSSTASRSRVAINQSIPFLKKPPGVEPVGLFLPPVDRR